MKCSTVHEIRTEMSQWLASFRRPILLVSADENIKSDVGEFVEFLEYPYVNVCLPRWAHRPNTFAHMKVQELKKEKFSIKGVTCPYETLHSVELVKVDRPNLQSGSHCAFYDGIEILLHIEFNNLWHLLYRISPSK